MSETIDRIPLLKAMDIASLLRKLWKMEGGAYETVGSVRRRRKDVGDIEFIAPLPIDGQDDTLFHVMQESIGRQGSLFGDDEAVRTISGRGDRGFKRNFKCCDLVLEIPEEMIGGQAPALFPVKVQIFRYVQSVVIAGKTQIGNRGWVELQRTGPADFGALFLQRWKRHWAIPETKQGSNDNFLCDRDGVPMDVPTEKRCFELLNNWRHVPPEERDELAERMKSTRSYA